MSEYNRILYSAEVFAVIEVQAGRGISSKAESRGKLTELLVVNDPVARVVQLELLGGEQASRRGESGFVAIAGPISRAAHQLAVSTSSGTVFIPVIR